MKQFTFLFCLLFISSISLAQNNTRQLQSFDELRVGDGIEVNLLASGKNSATVDVSTGSDSDITTNVENGILRINWSKKVDNYNRSATVVVNYTNLNALNVNGGSLVKTNNPIEAKDFQLKVSGGSKVQLEINCSNLVASCSAGSSVTISGEATSQEADVSSGSSYNTDDLITQTTSIEASTGSSAKVHATDTINAEASTGSSIKYDGNPSNKNIEESKYTGGSVKAAKK